MDKETDKPKTAKERLDIILDEYLKAPKIRNDRKTNEIEMRFGNIKKYKSINKIDYNNVAQRLYDYGFVPEHSDGFHSLRIFHEFLDGKGYKMSNVRTEIVGVDLIQKYCESNSLQKLIDLPSTTFDKLKFTQKTTPKDQNNDWIKAAVFEEFNMKISYQLEQTYTALSPLIRGIIDKWENSKKTFRFLNRVRFVHMDLPLFADLSIVKKSKTTQGGNVPMKVYTVQESDVFISLEEFEIEMEIDNSRVGIGTDYKDQKSLMELIRKSMRMILSGLQQTNYPISYVEQDNILTEYMKMLHGPQYEKSRILPKHFIGPSPYTLQLRNVIEKNNDLKCPNIRMNYTVTDKADGDRCLLYISEDGKLYLINTNMQVIFTGSKTDRKDTFNSLLDGELIRYDKNKEFINLFACFDIYYINKQSVREFGFIMPVGVEEKKENPKYRLKLLNDIVKILNIKNILKSEGACKFNIKVKKFESSNENQSIFLACNKILTDIDDNIYEYITDGLIFTPSDTGVGSDVVGTAGPLKKIGWDHAFKWKPPHYNTIDFLVSIKKDKTGKDEIHNIFQDGVCNTKTKNLVQYKTLQLRCGFDKNKDGYLNPFNDVINNNFPINDNDSNENNYKPVLFQPTKPYDENACFANILLNDNGSDKILLTEENEIFEENMIVEFKYDMNKSPGWRWIPLRVRYDKTTELRNGVNQFGNAYKVANEIWQNIHNPITLEMIKSGENIPEYLDDYNNEEDTTTDNVYYNRNQYDVKKSKSMRDFHNLYIKKKLINGVSEANDTLIDYGVGKAGDIAKWSDAKLSFIFGIDENKDNINNRIDGACARYLNEFKNKRKDKVPRMLFVNGNCSSNIRNGEAFETKKEKEIVDAVFGNGPKDESILGKGVYEQYGKGKEGFNISSCQFAMHYFFENETTLNNFVRNLSECTKLNGHFIGCCFDGDTVFKKLAHKNKGESLVIMENGIKKFELKKLYSQTGFPDDETSLNYPISVYQDTIGMEFEEYLVNFKYFIRVMENYGFVLMESKNAINIGFPDSTGMFEELFKNMENDLERDVRNKNIYGKASHLTREDKEISFLNRYFIFVKVRNVDAEKNMKQRLNVNIDEVDADDNKTKKTKKTKKVTVIKETVEEDSSDSDNENKKEEKVIIKIPKKK